MAKGPEITDEVRMLIARLHKEHPKWTNSMIRNEVLDIVHKKDPSLPRDWPSKFSIDRIMPDIRERARLSKLNPDPLDQPWTIQSMSKSEYHIPPEALPSVLEAWAFFQDGDRTLTIREAQWVACLYAAIKDTENLCWHATFMSTIGKRAQDAGITNYMGSQSDNLHVYSSMTGYVITREQERKFSGLSEEQWRTIERLWPVYREHINGIKASMPKGTRSLRSGIHYEKGGIFEEMEPTQMDGFFPYMKERLRDAMKDKDRLVGNSCEKLEETKRSQKEVQNERKHKAKKQK